jgi:S23 ribosomal protein.
MHVTKEIYTQTQNFPKEEAFGLTSQIRRSVTSIPSNIAEGHARSYTKDYLRFISIAQGSLAELETQLILAIELNFSKKEDIENILNELDEIGRMLSGLKKSLDTKN